MHIDHLKLIELLSEASGIEKDEVEKQLAQLSDEIQQAISDGDAYEVEGFGIFSGIGKNLIFIPSDELSTEINYKYVGMEAISVDNTDESETEEDVFSESESEPESESEFVDETPDTGIETSDEEKGEDTESDLDIDPFAGLLDDADTETALEDSSEAEDLSFEDESEAEENDELKESSVGNESDAVETKDQGDGTTDDAGDSNEIGKRSYDDVFDDLIFGEEEGGQPKEEGKPSPGPEKWGIDTYRDESDENMFSGLLGEKDTSEPAEENRDVDKSTNEPTLNVQFDEDADTEASALTADDEDFDDPFRDFEDTDEDEDEMQQEQNDDEIVPVITNISSGTGEKEKPENTGLKPKTRSSRDRKSSPVFLWLLLALIISGGATYALGYYGIINIPGIKSKIVGNTSTPSETVVPPAAEEEGIASSESGASQESVPKQSQPSTAEQDLAQNNEQTPTQEESVPIQEEPVLPEEQVETSDVTQDMQEAPAGQPMYGLMGIPVVEANDGYTIVIYSLSVQKSAENQKQLLLDRGFRALVYSLPHAQYGTLYRVSIGQFESLRDAALAAENLKPPYSESYFITNIQPTN